LAEEELMQYHLMVKQVYRLELDVPPPTLKGTQAIPEANAYFREAMKYRDKGVGQQYTLNQRRAELLFQRILTEHPTSDKISDSAYQLATIYESRANNQYARAAVYYERCFQWNPITHHDARIRAARLYDRQLNNRTKASEIYQDIIAKETNNETVREEARRRMAEFGMRK
jgi:tetratricopeptide (TPR) repeat protein